MDAVAVGELEGFPVADRHAAAGAFFARHPLAVLEMPAALGTCLGVWAFNFCRTPKAKNRGRPRLLGPFWAIGLFGQ